MKAEIDVALRDPCEKINLTLIESYIENSSSYKVILKISGNYLLLSDNSNNYKIRIHEDGRIYVRKDYGSENESFDDIVVKELINGLKKFLNSTKFLEHFLLQDEINFNFSGKKAYGFFWKKYNELSSTGEKYFADYNLRTYILDNESIYIKLEPASSIPEHTSGNLFCN